MLNMNKREIKLIKLSTRTFCDEENVLYLHFPM